MLSKDNPNCFALYFKKPTSKSALCATITLSPTNSNTFGITLSIVSASFTMSSVMFVTSTTLCGIGFSGFTKHSNSSITSPFSFIFIIPISVIFSVLNERPVVSKSNTQYVVCKSCPFGFETDGTLSGTKYASTP